MPTTINGIGTTYFGRRNRRRFDGVCQFCNRPGSLENYETRLVFSIFFIPVIPLGKKQVLNYCAQCTRHNIVDYSSWERTRAEAVEASAAELARGPNDPAAAIKMHVTYDAFQMHDEAARFADALLTLHGDVPAVQFYLGGWFERTGQFERAGIAFDRAFQLESGNLQYQRAAAIGHIRAGQLEQAQRLLDSFRPPNAAFEPPLFLLLAAGFQDRQRHAEAMDLFEMVAAARPGLLKDRSFRKSVRKSERALGAADSLVGSERFYRSRVLWAAAAAVVLLAAWLGGDSYARAHRRLHVVNGLKTPLTVTLDERQTVRVPPQSYSSTPIREGKHRVTVAEPALDLPPTDFEVASPWFLGMFRSPAFVIDPTRSAAVVYQEVSYALPGNPAPPGSNEWHVGEPFMSFADVDYPFGSFPATVPVKAGESVRKSRLELVGLAPEQLVMVLTGLPDQAEKALPLAETHLRATPHEQLLLYYYCGLATQQGQLARCSDFLATRLADRPVLVDWHRVWQNVRQELADDDRPIIERYDAWLAADPDNSALLYLRGRCDPDAETALSYFQRSLAADADNPYPHLAQGVFWAGRAELRRARDAMGDAARLKPDDLQIKQELDRLRFALGEYADLERDLRASLTAVAFAADKQELLLATLVAAGKSDEAKQHVDTFVARTHGQFPEQAQALVRRMRNTLLYLEGKFEELVAATAQLDSADVALARYYAQFELGRVVEPPRGVSVLEEGQDAFALLCKSLALSDQGDAVSAGAARELAVERLRGGRRADRKTAAVLAKRGAWTAADLDQLPFDPRLRTIALVALADSCPTPPAQLLDLAEKLNHDRRFPHHFLRRTIERMRQR